MVTVDCGISAAAEAEYAAEQGMELVITDHHQPGKELAPGGGSGEPQPSRLQVSFQGPRRGGCCLPSWPRRQPGSLPAVTEREMSWLRNTST